MSDVGPAPETFVLAAGRGVLRLDEVAALAGCGLPAVLGDLGPVAPAAVRPTTAACCRLATDHGHDLVAGAAQRLLTLGGEAHGLGRWEKVRECGPGTVVFHLVSTRASGGGPLRLPDGATSDSAALAAVLGACATAEPRVETWALTAPEPRARRAFRADAAAGLPDLVEETGAWSRVTGLTRLSAAGSRWVKAAVAPATLRSLRGAAAPLQGAWLAAILLQKGRWAGDDLEVELFDAEAARTFQAVAEDRGVRWTRYGTLHPSGDPRVKLALRGRDDRRSLVALLGPSLPPSWAAPRGRSEDENPPGTAATLAQAGGFLRKHGDPHADAVDPEDLSKEHCREVADWLRPHDRWRTAERLADTLGLLGDDRVSWDEDCARCGVEDTSAPVRAGAAHPPRIVRASRMDKQTLIKWGFRRDIRAGIAAGVVFPLLPRHGIYLEAPKDGARFARLFIETWKRIPLGPRRRMLEHWRTDASPFVVYQPCIELLPNWSGRSRGRGLRGDFAVCKHGGHTLQFWTKIVAALPDDLVRDLIAHELAHVEQWACGRFPTAADPRECEEDADSTMEYWGFDASAMDEYMVAKGHIKVLDWDQMTARQKSRYSARVRQDGR